MRLRSDAAADALASLEAGSGLAGVELARGIFDVVTETMASAARVHIAERGRDPRRYVLLATGGAGPVHAWHLAARLGIERVVCPPSAGVASALGLLLAPARADRVATVAEPLARLDWDRFEATYRRLEEECRSVLAQAGLAPEPRESFVPPTSGSGVRTSSSSSSCPRDRTRRLRRDAIAEAFRAAYERAFSRVPPGVGIEVVNVRVAARAGGEGGASRADRRSSPRGRRGPRCPQGDPARVLPRAPPAGADAGLRSLPASPRRPLSGSRHRRGARVDRGGRAGRAIRDRRRGKPRHDSNGSGGVRVDRLARTRSHECRRPTCLA